MRILNDIIRKKEEANDARKEANELNALHNKLKNKIETQNGGAES